MITPLADSAVDIGTLVVPINDEIEATTVSFVKAACAFAPGQTIAPALYFSRQAIPWGLGPRWHHVGIYAYRRAVLDRYVSLPPSPLEQREKLANNCGRWRTNSGSPACAWNTACSGSTPPRILKSRLRHLAVPPPATPYVTIAFQGLPGAYSDLGSSQRLPGR